MLSEPSASLAVPGVAQSAEQQVGPLEKEKARVGAEREAARRSAEAEEQKLEERLRELQRDADRLKTVGTRIEM